MGIDYVEAIYLIPKLLENIGIKVKGGIRKLATGIKWGKVRLPKAVEEWLIEGAVSNLNEIEGDITDNKNIGFRAYIYSDLTEVRFMGIYGYKAEGNFKRLIITEVGIGRTEDWSTKVKADYTDLIQNRTLKKVTENKINYIYINPLIPIRVEKLNGGSLLAYLNLPYLPYNFIEMIFEGIKFGYTDRFPIDLNGSLIESWLLDENLEKEINLRKTLERYGDDPEKVIQNLIILNHLAERI